MFQADRVEFLAGHRAGGGSRDMADERSGTSKSKPTWRGQAEPKLGARTTKKSDYQWTKRGTKPSAVAKRRGSRPYRVLGGLAAFAACLGMVIWLILMIRRP